MLYVEWNLLLIFWHADALFHYYLFWFEIRDLLDKTRFYVSNGVYCYVGAAGKFKATFDIFQRLINISLSDLLLLNCDLMLLKRFVSTHDHIHKSILLCGWATRLAKHNSSVTRFRFRWERFFRASTIRYARDTNCLSIMHSNFF